MSPLENKYSTQIFAAPTSSQKSIPQDVLELVQSESAALYDIFEGKIESYSPIPFLNTLALRIVRILSLRKLLIYPFVM